LQNLFDKAIRDEEKAAKNEYYENYKKDNCNKRRKRNLYEIMFNYHSR
jgi:hypothetical protein